MHLPHILFALLFSVALASNPTSCGQVKCGSGSCCLDSFYGPVCYDTLRYGCPKDTKSGTFMLCGAGLGTCSGVCFDQGRYTCSNGVITNYTAPVVAPSPAPVSFPPQTADLRIINSCKTPLWLEARYGGAGAALPGQTSTTTLATSGSYVHYVIPDAGLSGTRFWAKYGCDSTGRNCEVGDSQQYWPGGGCPANGCTPPVDSLFEATWGCKPGSSCNSQSPTTWFDTSQVDGWTIPYKLNANGKTDGCDCGPSGCGFSGVDASKLDLAKCPSGEDLSLAGQYPQATVLGVNTSLSSVDLRLVDKNNQIIGCMSPCKKLTTGFPYGLQQSESVASGLWMCCPTPNPTNCLASQGCVTPQECRNGPVASTQYVQAVHNMAPGVYSYSYDDGVGLHACPAGVVTYTMEFCPNGQAYPVPL